MVVSSAWVIYVSNNLKDTKFELKKKFGIVPQII